MLACVATSGVALSTVWAGRVAGYRRFSDLQVRGEGCVCSNFVAKIRWSCGARRARSRGVVGVSGDPVVLVGVDLLVTSVLSSTSDGYHEAKHESGNENRTEPD